jgi:hypothetical protein
MRQIILLAARSETHGMAVAADVRRRISGRYSHLIPPRHFGGYLLSGLLAVLGFAFSLKGQVPPVVGGPGLTLPPEYFGEVTRWQDPRARVRYLWDDKTVEYKRALLMIHKESDRLIPWFEPRNEAIVKRLEQIREASKTIEAVYERLVLNSAPGSWSLLTDPLVGQLIRMAFAFHRLNQAIDHIQNEIAREENMEAFAALSREERVRLASIAFRKLSPEQQSRILADYFTNLAPEKVMDAIVELIVKADEDLKCKLGLDVLGVKIETVRQGRALDHYLVEYRWKVSESIHRLFGLTVVRGRFGGLSSPTSLTRLPAGLYTAYATADQGNGETTLPRDLALIRLEAVENKEILVPLELIFKE